MRAEPIIEPGVKFDNLEKEQLFHIEHSDIHKKTGEGIKTVEFIYLTADENVLFVEAKKTCPNVANKNDSQDKQKKYEQYYSEIADKFVDSINMFSATVLGINGYSDSVGEKIVKKRTYMGSRIRFVLVIAEAEESWLGGPKAELETRLLRYRKIWKADVLVLNPSMAVELGLIKGGS